MKIISKFKDYYDYLQGIFGIDTTIVYDRKFKHIVKYDPIDKEKVYKFIFAICGFEYILYIYKDISYYTVDEIKSLNEILRSDDKDEVIISRWNRWLGKYDIEKEWEKFQKIPTDVNYILREPVLMIVDHKSDGVYEHENKYYANVILNDYKFIKVMSPKEIYIKISTFIGYLKDYPEISNNQNDIEKVESHGFDKKISFRHRL